MGQDYLVVNLTKKEYLYPHRFGEGTKLTEFAAEEAGTMFALGLLLADNNAGAGGGLHSQDPICARGVEIP
jgi:hypothetical protein